MALPRAGADIQLEIGDYERQIRRIIQGANDADSALGRLVTSANNASRALSSLSSADINISVNDGALDTAITLINDLDGSVSLDIDVTDSELDMANDIATNLDGSVSLDVNVTDSEINATDETISGWRLPINLTFDVGQIPSAVTGLFDTFGDVSGLSGLMEMDVIMSRMAGTTSEMIPDADKLINDIFTNGWGESRTQIAETMTLAQQYGIELEDIGTATENALILSNITGEDPSAILRTMTNMVRTELVPSFEEAGDVITTGFQNGLNIGDDFLDTLNEYGTTFSTLGFDAEEALNVLNAGLDAGIDNTDRIADSFREFGIRVNENSDVVSGAISDLGLDDMAEDFRQGEIAGDDFITSVMNELAKIEDPAEQSRIAVELFGTQFEDFDPQTFITALTDVDGQLEVTEGALADAGTEISNNLPDAIDRARRALSTGIGEFLDEQLNITGLMDDLASDIQTFFDETASGTSVGGAFRIAFDDNEVVDILLDVREVISDGFFGLGIALADVLDFIPGATGRHVREALSTMAGGELQIDLATAETADDIGEAITEAIDRGVSDSDALELLNNQFNDAVSVGDVEQVVALRDAMQNIMDMQSGDALGSFFDQSDIDSIINSSESAMFNVSSDATGALGDIARDDFQSYLDGIFDEYQIPEEFRDTFSAQLAGMVTGDDVEGLEISPDFDLEGMRETANEMINTLESQMNDAMNNEDWAGALNFASALDEATGDDYVAGVEMLASEAGVNFDELEAVAEDASMGVSTSVDDMTTSVDSGMTTLGESVSTSSTDLGTSLSGVELGVNDLRDTFDTDLPAMERQYNLSIESMRADTQNLADDIGGLNEGFLSLGMNIGSMPSSVGGGSTNYSNTVNQTNYNTSPAQSANANAQVADAISSFP